MTSLRLRLFIILISATGLIWLAAVSWIYISSQRELEHVLDTRLQEAARMVASLAEGLDRSPVDDTNPKTFNPIPLSGYERQLSCQIWSLDGQLIAKSSGAPEGVLTDRKSGFSDHEINGEAWRVYAVEDASKGVRVLVGDRLGFRERLVGDLVKGLLWPALLIIPLLGILIWLSLNRGFRPLTWITHDLAHRKVDDMSPVNVTSTPSEVRPLTDALNQLFAKMDLARRHERDLTAFAAHELRTPLAGLKAQAQVAIAADDPLVMKRALRQILVSVDRTSRLVRQLLAIARLDAGVEDQGSETIAIGGLIDEIAAATARPDAVTVSVDERLATLTWVVNRECLELAIRNLHENAIQHMPSGNVRWRLGSSPNDIVVEDEGPGIPENELSQVGTRFFRGQFKSAVGSGLGLTISQLALERIGARLLLKNRTDTKGLRAEVLRQA
ncbi:MULTISPECIES: sensor histidine kinase N-terminal domain-containing protein [unclassified Nitrobacter]|uniref:sensor histidine kinase N-terminal domain-containing protein n=1 Tax=unclassified Nitrobacter TaxID=2620411 RepID=UPI00092C617C|nr:MULTISPECIES: sensor histidine kinase N-terminal domain-containing protein [unclassified Nitrobacter]MBN9147102.1 sensor histidine kinase N-terminal domain-containing protein [Nitrobacter sp.]OJV02394.1 MAG: two-component sensor histidine kinase [Nitrobacter sp. 62-23]